MPTKTNSDRALTLVVALGLMAAVIGLLILRPESAVAKKPLPTECYSTITERCI